MDAGPSPGNHNTASAPLAEQPPHSQKGLAWLQGKRDFRDMGRNLSSSASCLRRSHSSLAHLTCVPLPPYNLPMATNIVPSLPLVDPHAILASLPRWQRILLARINAGDDLNTARGKGSGASSLASIEDAKNANPDFARLLADAFFGRIVFGEETARENARAYAVPALDDAYQESTGTDRDGKAVDHRDRISNRRLLIDVAGLGGRDGPGVAVQVNLNALGYEAWVREQGSSAHVLPRGEAGTGIVSSAAKPAVPAHTPPREAGGSQDGNQA